MLESVCLDKPVLNTLEPSFIHSTNINRVPTIYQAVYEVFGGLMPSKSKVGPCYYHLTVIVITVLVYFH